MVAFYVCAHEDDWEFFRGDHAYGDIVNGVKTVFIYTSAGDAGRTDGWWEARERGAKATVQVPNPGQQPENTTVTIRGHFIRKFIYANTVSYFLRLPDGYMDGSGYPSTNYQSLRKLRQGDPAYPIITSVDGHDTYTSWADFCLTLKALMQSEWEPTENHPTLNAPDYSDTWNPGDHADHLATAEALQTFVIGTYWQALWIGYHTQDLPQNVWGDNYLTKEALYNAYSDASGDVKPDEWAKWGPRSYYRVVEVFG
jgi:hypothetical protein